MIQQRIMSRYHQSLSRSVTAEFAYKMGRAPTSMGARPDAVLKSAEHLANESSAIRFVYLLQSFDLVEVPHV